MYYSYQREWNFSPLQVKILSHYETLVNRGLTSKVRLNSTTQINPLQNKKFQSRLSKINENKYLKTDLQNHPQSSQEIHIGTKKSRCISNKSYTYKTCAQKSHIHHQPKQFFQKKKRKKKMGLPSL